MSRPTGDGEDRAPEDEAERAAPEDPAQVTRDAALPTPLPTDAPGAGDRRGDEHAPSYGTLPGRWGLLRDAAAFQVKLVVDGLRDVLLSPVSLIAAIAGLALGRHDWFYDVLHVGRRSEKWIDLFSAARRVGQAEPTNATEQTREAERPRYYRRSTRSADAQERDTSASQAPPEPPQLPAKPRTWYSDSRWSEADQPGAESESIDDLIQALETRLQEQYRRGGVTARAKHTIDRMLDAVEKRYREGQRTPPSSDN